MNKELKENNINKVAVIGLGYVGLPLAVEFGKQIKKTIGFDINVKRVDQLLNGIDITSETNKDDLIKSKYLKLDFKDYRSRVLQYFYCWQAFNSY